MKKHKFNNRRQLYQEQGANTRQPFANKSSAPTPKKDIQRMLALCSTAHQKVQSLPDNSAKATRIFTELIASIISIFNADYTTEDLLSECDQVSQSQEHVTHIVELTVDSTDRCIQIINRSLAKKDYVPGLVAAKELLEAIHDTFNGLETA